MKNLLIAFSMTLFMVFGISGVSNAAISFTGNDIVSVHEHKDHDDKDKKKKNKKGDKSCHDEKKSEKCGDEAKKASCHGEETKKSSCCSKK